MAYPASLDDLTTAVPSDGNAPTTALDDATYPHDDHHRALGVAVEAIETELGTDPAGASATVKARLDTLDTTVAAKVPKSLVTTAGDVIYATGADTPARLGIGTAGQVLTVNSGATAPEWADAAGGGLDAPWHQFVDVRAEPYAQTNMASTTFLASSLYAFARIDSGPAGAASISYKFPMSAGTYSIEIVAYADTYMPIVTAKIDGTTVGTVDFYKTGGIVQREGAITGITVATSGTKTVNLTNATKNASSSGYTFYLMALRILRTA